MPLIDVRTPGEFASGHLSGAKLIDIEAPSFAAEIAKLDKTATYAVYCRSGNRSAAALQAMRQAGIHHAFHLCGGIGAWTSAGRPTVTG